MQHYRQHWFSTYSGLIGTTLLILCFRAEGLLDEQEKTPNKQARAFTTEDLCIRFLSRNKFQTTSLCLMGQCVFIYDNYLCVCAFSEERGNRKKRWFYNFKASNYFSAYMRCNVTRKCLSLVIMSLLIPPPTCNV